MPDKPDELETLIAAGQTYAPPPSHLDVEQPQFSKVPHVWIQWKGTDVCADIHCTCGELGHFDGDFFYFFKCPNCGQHWEVGTHVRIYPVTKERAEQGCVQYPEQQDF